MSYNSFGRFFRITTYGESHGPHIGVVIDGCPAGLNIDQTAIANDLARRRPGQSELSTERSELEAFTISSGLMNGVTTGAPIHLSIPNKNARSKDYNQLKDVHRPSHADYTYSEKYGLRDHRGGGRSSARETACRVAAGAIAKQLLRANGMDILAFTRQIGEITSVIPDKLDTSLIERSIVRCPDHAATAQMADYILQLKDKGDTCGGIIQCQVTGVPVGLGSPIYDKLEARLAYAIMSINACIGFEMGTGFDATKRTGSEMNDAFYVTDDGIVKTRTNNSGGIQGGISNGMPVVFKAAFKPVSSIKSTQKTIDRDNEEIDLKIDGRHDPCVVPRAVPIVEAMTALVLVDFMLARRIDRV